MTQEIAFWALMFQVVHAMLTAAVGVYVIFMKRAQISADRLTALEHNIGTRLDDHDVRLSRVESACNYAPTHKDLGKIYERINGVSGQVSEVSGRMEALGNTVDIIHRYLMNKGES